MILDEGTENDKEFFPKYPGQILSPRGIKISCANLWILLLYFSKEF
jgi:hypothetical protein